MPPSGVLTRTALRAGKAPFGGLRKEFLEGLISELSFGQVDNFLQLIFSAFKHPFAMILTVNQRPIHIFLNFHIP